MKILRESNFLYLSMEVRTGKTLTSLSICERLKVKNVLFVTKKKAIYSIEEDYTLLNPSYYIKVINYESLHKIEDRNWDCVILDEAHSMGAFPKPSKRAKQVKGILKKHNPYVILLSGTPTPESFSQVYHQVYGIKGNPFSKYSNFYKFASDYVNVRQKYIGSFRVNDYSSGKTSILVDMKPYMMSYSQKNAGFKSSIEEEVLYVDMKDSIYDLCSRLKNNLVVEGQEEVILADTGVKLMQKLHQMYSGTVKFESGNSMVLDYSKAEFIKERFKDNKIGIFYKFKEELNALKKVYGNQLCTDLSDIDSHKVIALQIVSGREGISLKAVDYLVYFNIDFSATSYWQSRDRMTTKERAYNKIYWIFSRGGIEDKIYRAVKGKKNYTLTYFKKDYELR